MARAGSQREACVGNSNSVSAGCSVQMLRVHRAPVTGSQVQAERDGATSSQAESGEYARNIISINYEKQTLEKESTLTFMACLVSFVAAAGRPPFGPVRPPAALSRAAAVTMATRKPLIDLKMVPTRAALKDAPMPECVAKYGAPSQHTPPPFAMCSATTASLWCRLRRRAVEQGPQQALSAAASDERRCRKMPPPSREAAGDCGGGRASEGAGE